MTSEERRQFKELVSKVYDMILANQTVLIHCSAGLHRTGMFAYALLRKGNIAPFEALQIIGEIRIETRNALEDKYTQSTEELY